MKATHHNRGGKLVCTVIICSHQLPQPADDRRGGQSFTGAATVGVVGVRTPQNFGRR